MKNCVREDGSQYKKHIMPERGCLCFDLKICRGGAGGPPRYKRYKEYAVIKKNNLQEN